LFDDTLKKSRGVFFPFLPTVGSWQEDRIPQGKLLLVDKTVIDLRSPPDRPLLSPAVFFFPSEIIGTFRFGADGVFASSIRSLNRLRKVVQLGDAEPLPLMITATLPRRAPNPPLLFKQ